MANTKIPAELSSTPGIIDNSNATAITIDSSENVGIGTGSPASATGYTVLTLNNATNGGNLQFHHNGTYKGVIYNSSSQFRIEAGASTPMVFANPNGEAMRIDASGNLLVGKTSAAGQSSAGIEVRGDGVLIATKAGTVQYLNRTGSDGAILNFAKDGTTVGSIVSRAGLVSSIVLDPRASGSGLTGTSDAILPTEQTGTPTNNNIDLGNSSLRFKDIYLGGGVYVGGTGSANKLDDYEEGTWTPTLLTGSGTFSGATYTKVGRIVTCNFIVTSITDRTSSAAFIIESLPFAANSGDRCATLGAIPRDINSSFASFDGAYFDTTTRMSFYTTSTAGYRQLFHSDMSSANSTIYIAFTYMAA